MRNATFRFLALVVAVFLISGATPVQAQGTFAHGAVVALQDTPHLWFADEHGVLHWGGDTRALTGKHIAWNNRVEVSLDQLRTLPVGDPWLSAGLLKDGDPIYLVKWESNWEQPQLLHIQSIKDVELFGINGSNYGKFVLDKGTWEARYGMSAAGLQRSALASAVSTSAPESVTTGVPQQISSWPDVPVIPLNTTHRFVEEDFLVGDPTWEVTVLEVVRGDAIAGRIKDRGSYGYKPPPADQEDVAVKIRVRYLGRGKRLGDDFSALGYAVCHGWLRYLSTCTSYSHRNGFELVMENGEEAVFPGWTGYALGEAYGSRPILHKGESKEGWTTWRVWKDMEVFFVVKLDDDQKDFGSYVAVFATR